jgi:hypothetical protein
MLCQLLLFHVDLLRRFSEAVSIALAVLTIRLPANLSVSTSLAAQIWLGQHLLVFRVRAADHPLIW